VDTINLPSGITLPTAFGAPPAPLQPGQVIQALVLELIERDIFRLQLPQAVVDVKSGVALTPGSVVTLAVKSAGPNARLTIYADQEAPINGRTVATRAAAPGTTGQGDAPKPAARQPIGEAVIIARQQTGAQPKVTTDAVVTRDAPSINSVRPLAHLLQIPMPITPEHALSEAVRAAAARQSGLAPLFADVEQVATGDTLPTPVRAAAAQVLALRVPLDEGLTAADVKQAFMRSGVLFEPRLAAARPPAVQAAIRAEAIPHEVPAGDLKAALLVFRQVLKVWASSVAQPVAPAAPSIASAGKVLLEIAKAASPIPLRDATPAQRPDVTLPLAPQFSDAAGIKRFGNALSRVLASEPHELLASSISTPLSPEQATSLAKNFASAMLVRVAPPQPALVSPNGGPPPPYRGAPLAAQPPELPSIGPDATPHEAAERLIAGTDGAIARTTLLQAASLPDQLSASRTGAHQRWTFEIPFATQQGTGIAQFEVSRDGSVAQGDTQARVWRARFSLDVEPMGPVHALVALTGDRASVTLWAERLSTATQLNDHAPQLSDALRAAKLEAADFQFRVGVPPVAARQAAPGRFMDRAS